MGSVVAPMLRSDHFYTKGWECEDLEELLGHSGNTLFGNRGRTFACTAAARLTYYLYRTT